MTDQSSGELKTHFSHKPQECPKCGHRPVAEIWYGEMAVTEQLLAEIKAGRVVLGGCCLEDPIWECARCHWQGIQDDKTERKAT